MHGESLPRHESIGDIVGNPLFTGGGVTPQLCGIFLLGSLDDHNIEALAVAERADKQVFIGVL